MFTIQVSLGECLDRLSIIKVKLKKISDIKKQQILKAEERALEESISKSRDQTQHIAERIDKTFPELVALNEAAWDLIDLNIKAINENDFPSAGRNIKKLHEFNCLRIKLRNDIDSAAGEEVTEVKNYV